MCNLNVQSLVVGRQRKPQIDVDCQLLLANLPNVKTLKGAFCQSRGETLAAASASVAADASPTAGGCAGTVLTEIRKQRFDKHGSATIRLKKLNSTLKRLLQQSATVQVEVCSTIHVPGKDDVTLKRVVDLVRGHR